MFDFKEFLSSARRVLMVSKKPSPKDYWVMAKITGLGIIIIGIIGYAVYLLALLLGMKQL